jgi:hypothetical protein
MNRIVGIAVVVFLILLISAIFISPIVDIQPSALRAQQWLSFIVAMFSLALQLILFMLKITLRVGPSLADDKVRLRINTPDLTCCLLC